MTITYYFNLYKALKKMKAIIQFNTKKHGLQR